MRVVLSMVGDLTAVVIENGKCFRHYEHCEALAERPVADTSFRTRWVVSNLQLKEFQIK